jgi:hypothetical protein
MNTPINDRIRQQRRWIRRLIPPLRFRIRGLLAFMLLVAVLSTWLGKHILRSAIERPVVAKMVAAGAQVCYDYQIDPRRHAIDTTRPPVGSKLVRSLLGDDIYATADVVIFDKGGNSDADLVGLHKLSGLREVALDGPGFTDACIDELLKIAKLRILNLLDTAITPEGLQRLGACGSLESLSLYGRSISDAHVLRLQSFPQLKYLQLTRTSITDNSLTTIGAIHDLVSLDVFEGNAVSDRGIESLAHLDHLRQLRLLNTAITDRALETVAKLTRLEIIQFNSPAVTDGGLCKLSRLTALEHANFYGTQLADNGIKAISNAKQLRTLDVSATHVTDGGMDYLSALTKLEEISLNNTAVTNAGLIKLKTLRGLKKLDVGLNKGITLEGVDALKAAIPDCTINCFSDDPDGSGVLSHQVTEALAQSRRRILEDRHLDLVQLSCDRPSPAPNSMRFSVPPANSSSSMAWSMSFCRILTASP